MLKILNFNAILFALCLPACITINVYFPAAAAQKAADKIIDKVYGTEQQPDQKEQEESGSKENDKSGSLSPRSTWVLHWLISPVYAQEANVDISSPTIETLSNRMAKRHKQLLPFYDSGALGLTQEASIILREPNKIPLKSRNEVKKLVAEENRDRLELYREIAVANDHPEWENKIQAVFAKRWIERASSGWWYQDKDGQWRQR